MPTVLVAMVLASDAIAAAAFVLLYPANLPEVVASKFGTGGIAYGFMARNQYMGLMAGLAVLLPATMGCAFSWIPRHSPRWLNVPNKDYWLANGIPPQLLRMLDLVAIVLSSASALFIVGLHWLVSEANQLSPARLAMEPFWVLLGIFLAAVLGASIWLSLAFRRPRA